VAAMLAATGAMLRKAGMQDYMPLPMLIGLLKTHPNILRKRW